ncbi:MAG: cobalt transporter CbiM [bacterium]|nr:cobalt transporter CbiM [bacterium]
MHIPDNYLSPSTCAVMAAAMVPVWAISVKKVRLEVTREKMPLIGVGAALSFLGMMFNVPLVGGTTGHIVGGTLLALLCGPYAACIAVTIALLIQALIFGDGGILAFGANCFNMAFVLPFVGYYITKAITQGNVSRVRKNIGRAVGSYIGINIAALCAAIEFGIQPYLFQDSAGHALYCPYPLNVSIPAMLAGHLLIAGVLEAVVTVAVLEFVEKTSPGLIYKRQETKKNYKPLYGLLLALIALTPLGLLAAGTAWGEWGADEIVSVMSGGKALGYTPAKMESGFTFNSIFPDYSISGMPEWLGYILSAVAGTAILVILFKIISSFMKSKGKYAR